jgi:hypothetical protein
MIVAAKALAVTGADLFSDRQLVLDANADFRGRWKDRPINRLCQPARSRH